MIRAISATVGYFQWMCRIRAPLRERILYSWWVFVGIVTYSTPVMVNWHWRRFTGIST